MRALLTGGAGFIGSHVLDLLLAEGGWQVVALDNFDPFYDPAVKRRNLAAHMGDERLELLECDITDPGIVDRLRGHRPFDVIIHLAAKAGVRGSIAEPAAYHRTNVLGTQALLDVARDLEIPTFVYASSSSVYGVNIDVPWREDAALEPISPYACSKAAGELLAHAYSHLYGIRCCVLRLFTVYGPRQRPDLAIHHFARKILDGQPIQLFGDGTTLRDYTYVADIVAGIRSAMSYRHSPYEVFNLGAGRPVQLNALVTALARALDREARIEHIGEQAGDVPLTYSSIDKSRQLLGYRPRVSLDKGLANFVAWFRQTEPDRLPLATRG
ncbi:MAG: NAD-dependent epimerase/dehydratase family protein [Egibacteraceae bacterium]